VPIDLERESETREHQTREPERGEQRGEGFNRPTTYPDALTLVDGWPIGQALSFSSRKAHTDRDRDGGGDG